MSKAVEQPHVPAQCSGRDRDRRNRVADVVIAVPESPLAVLPGLAPENRREGDVKGRIVGSVEEFRGESLGAAFHRMGFGRVVSEESGGVEGGDGRGDDVGFGGVEVAAAGVDAEGPRGEAGGLPRGEGEGVVEETREGGLGERVRGGWEGGKEGGVGGGVVGERGEVEEGDGRGKVVAEEWVGLVGPVQAAWAAGVAGGEGVLGAVVVIDCLLLLLLVVLLWLVLWLLLLLLLLHSEGCGPCRVESS